MNEVKIKVECRTKKDFEQVKDNIIHSALIGKCILRNTYNFYTCDPTLSCNQCLNRYIDWAKPEKYKPKTGDNYYYVDSNGKVVFSTYIENAVGAEQLAIGNCFYTREEADEKAEEVKAVFSRK